jgi:hypothetical protein
MRDTSDRGTEEERTDGFVGRRERRTVKRKGEERRKE